MKRTIEQWKNCDPNAMARELLDAATLYALQDAKADILELHAENLRLQRILSNQHEEDTHL